jgi:hypothetical protein
MTTEIKKFSRAWYRLPRSERVRLTLEKCRQSDATSEVEAALELAKVKEEISLPLLKMKLFLATHPISCHDRNR